MTSALVAVVRHPALWVTAVRQGWRLVPSRWWRHRPFLPVPSRQYLRFRLLTQYGDNVGRPQPEDVLNYLRWCRDWERIDH
jgi:hypothetical protein